MYDSLDTIFSLDFLERYLGKWVSSSILSSEPCSVDVQGYIASYLQLLELNGELYSSTFRSQSSIANVLINIPSLRSSSERGWFFSSCCYLPELFLEDFQKLKPCLLFSDKLRFDQVGKEVWEESFHDSSTFTRCRSTLQLLWGGTGLDFLCWNWAMKASL